MIRLAIVGSRHFNDWDVFQVELALAFAKWKIDVGDIACVISGGAKGADSMAKRWAEEKSLRFVEFAAGWNEIDPKTGKRFGRSAGPRRNKKLVGEATHVVAFPSAGGCGTQNAIMLAKKFGRQLHECEV